ncbi:anaerobic ribonucleoside-triphosphate reductase activating protein [Hydrogenimonas sp. SS33]|uniref:anaerobic ribonucleoside-triphosphate reductase activating protein n=1 Tax=Hydrogenimonas leucolamina TaxID=2954236 RepID=UPI00336BAF87
MSSDRIIYDITPFTHLDYPGKLAAIAWFVGCNMRCMYCYNSDIVFSKEGEYTPDDLFGFLSRRKGLLDGVVLSGGEPTLHDLKPLCEKIKSMGFSVKLDTNGLNTGRIRTLVETELVDFIALDFKAQNGKFGYITGSSRFESFKETLMFLSASKFPFEVRTTVHPDLLQPPDINKMMQTLEEAGYRGTYYLQRFIPTPNTIAQMEAPASSFDESLLEKSVPLQWR